MIQLSETDYRALDLQNDLDDTYAIYSKINDGSNPLFQRLCNKAERLLNEQLGILYEHGFYDTKNFGHLLKGGCLDSDLLKHARETRKLRAKGGRCE